MRQIRTFLVLIGAVLAACVGASGVVSTAEAAGTATIAGTVTVPTGSPVATYVTVVGEDGLVLHAGFADEHGAYRITGVPPGRVTLRFSPVLVQPDLVPAYYGGATRRADATVLDLVAGQERTGLDHAFQVGHSIAGTVREQGTGAPVEGTVTVMPRGGGAADSRFVTSKPDGSYRLSGVADDDYVIGFSYGRGTIGPIAGYHENATTIEDADAVTVAGGDRAGIDASIPPPPLSIGGRVLDVDGEPIEGVSVLASGALSGFGSATTGADGRYRIAGIPAGGYTVEFAGTSNSRFRTQYFDGAPTLVGATTVTVVGGTHRTDVDARLQEQPHVRGTVTDAATGDPVNRARVYVLASDGRFAGGTETDEQGRYTLTPGSPSPAAGSYRVVFTGPGGVLPPESGSTNPGYVEVPHVDNYVPRYFDGADRRASATLVDVPADGGVAGVDGALERGGSITGRIERSGGGGSAADLYVTAYAADGQPVGETQTDGDGDYALRSLAPGDYRVRFASTSARVSTSDPTGTRYYRSGTTRAGAEPVTVVRGQATVLDTVDLDLRPSISGRVLVAGTGAPPVTPLTTAYLYRWDGIIATVVGTTFVSTVDGSYRFDGIAPGRYSVGFGGGGYGSLYFDGTPGGVGNVEEATRFDLEAGDDLVDIDAALRGDARIIGTVTLEDDGAPAPGVSVVARDAETGDELRAMDTGADGTYWIPGLTPGVPVVLEFRPPHDLNAVGGFYGGETLATATRVTPGASPQVADYALAPAPPAASVSGTVVFGGWGEGIIGATAHLSDGTRSWTTAIEPETIYTGTYRFVGLPAGRYELRIEAPSDPTMLPRPADEIVLTTAEDRTLSPIVLEYGAIFAGRVRPVGSTTGLAGVVVELSRTDGTSVATTTTDAAGEYRIGPVPAGGHRLRFDPSAADASLLEQYHPGAAYPEQAPTFWLNPRGQGALADATLVRAPSPAPTTGGRALVGVRLTATGGTWSHVPTERNYRWFICPSADAPSSACEVAGHGTFEPRDYQLGSYVEVEETATVAGSRAAFRSNRVGPVRWPVVPAIESPPTIAGDPVVNVRLDGTAGSWAHDPSSFRYAWYRCAPSDSCTAISGATRLAYVPTAADIGYGIELGVVARNDDGDSVEARSLRSAVVPPKSNRPGTVSGVAREGETLVGAPGTWIKSEWLGDGSGVTVERWWLRCDAAGTACVPIDGATGATYALGAADVGRTLRLREVAEKNGGVSEPADSAATSVVTALEPTNAVAPSVDGTTRVGSTLTAGDGSWAPATGPFTYERRWLRCVGADCAAIGGAVGATYALTAEDVGAGIAVEVRATRLGRSTEWVRSSSVGPVLPPAPTVVGAPTINGTTVRDQTLAVTDGTWNHAPTAYAYRWLRCSSITACTEISDATGNRYRLSAADVGQRIAAEVRASNAGGASAWARTALSPVITAPRDPDPDPPGGGDPPGGDPPGDDPPGDRPPGENPPGSDHRPGGDQQPGANTPKQVTAARVSTLRLEARGTRLQLRFRGGSKVRTTVTVSSRKALPIRGKRQVVRLASVTIASPRTTTVRLSALARQALRGRRSLPVTVRVAPRGGKAVTQRLTLRVR